MNELIHNPTFIWFVIGLSLFLLELVLPGFVVIFFGFGAWVAALAFALFGFGINGQIVIFLVASISSLLVLRKYLTARFFSEDKSNPASLNDEFIGHTAIAVTDFNKGFKGKINFKGTQWSVISEEDVKAGDLLEIIGKESITLIVKHKS